MMKKTDRNLNDQDLADAVGQYMNRVQDCFKGLGEERAKRLSTFTPSIESIEEALMENGGIEASRAHDIAFHLIDWLGDAAFLVALHLFPERFSKQDVVKGVSMVLAHAPNHLAAAAKLFGIPVQDVFNVGALDRESDLYE